MPFESFNIPTISDALYKTCVNLIRYFGRIDERENGHHANAKHRGSVLVFLPGIREIEILFDLLEAARSRYVKARLYTVQVYWLQALEVKLLSLYYPCVNAVSYTHLDVYKRQLPMHCRHYR